MCRYGRTFCLVGLSVLPSLVACEPTSTLSTAAVRDSAGVRIVAFDAPAVVDTLAGDPVLTLGTEGDPLYEFFQLREVLPLASGNLVAVNGGTSELRFFGPDGAHLRTVGRRGEGPAEFGFLTTAWLGAGDTIRVHDPRRRRIVVFDSAGSFVRGTPFADDLPAQPPEGSAPPCFVPGLAGLLADGARVVWGWGCFGFEGSDGIREMRVPLSVVRDDGVAEVGELVQARYWERGNAESLVDQYAFLPLSSSIRWATHGTGLVVSDGRSYELQLRDSVGGVEALYRESPPPPAITPEIRAAYEAELAEDDREHPADVPYPERLGGYEGLIVADDGAIWAARMAAPGAAGARWSVFSRDGSTLRHVVLPDGRLSAVRDGRLYLVTTDDLGIQRIRVLDDPAG